MTLLTRDAFREAVFARDHHRCVICRAPAQDAHHILERRLFPDGGYYLDNGASLCEEHHLQAEMTLLTVEQIRAACGITRPIVPPHLYPDQVYDKWGNPILDNGQRMRGELFDDESVQKALAQGGVLNLFTKYVKYPRTYHLPWSEKISADDRVLDSLASFEGQEVAVTLKMDGENTTMYRDYIHARALTNQRHPSRFWVKNFHAQIAHDIPDGWRVCGENLYAEHAIHYTGLESYFYGFSVWNEQNVCLDWNQTIEYLALLGIPVVPVLYRGPWNEAITRSLYQPTHSGCECEGYVVRLTGGFHYREFRHSVAKFVRRGHASKHDFYRQAVVANELQAGRKPREST